eukprot:scaffold819_cov350-Prasinococcus_capsulatus_cf.AAC.11
MSGGGVLHSNPLRRLQRKGNPSRVGGGEKDAAHRVVAQVAIDHIATRATVDNVVARQAVDGVRAHEAKDAVAASRSCHPRRDTR